MTSLKPRFLKTKIKTNWLMWSKFALFLKNSLSNYVGGKGDRIAGNCVLFSPIGEYFAKFAAGISSLVPSVNKLQISSLPSQLSHQPNTIKPGQVHYLGTHGACDAAQSLIWLMNQLWQGILCSALYPWPKAGKSHQGILSLCPSCLNLVM